MHAFLGLGSNLGDRWSNLALGVEGLAELDPGLVVSPIYATAPIGGPKAQGEFLNCVVSSEVDCSPTVLLARCLEIERRAHRVRRERWGPRTLDVDVLFLDDLVIDTPELTVPHPRARERAFVLVPLADLDAGLAGRLDHIDTTEVRRVGALVRARGSAGERR